MKEIELTLVEVRVIVIVLLDLLIVGVPKRISNIKETKASSRNRTAYSHCI